MSKYIPKITRIKVCHPEFDDYYLEYELVEMGLYPKDEAFPELLFNGRNANSLSTYYDINDCKEITEEEVEEYWEKRRKRIKNARNKGKTMRAYDCKNRPFNRDSYKGYWSDQFLLEDHPEILEKLRNQYSNIQIGA